jgi:hypothetical protein
MFTAVRIALCDDICFTFASYAHYGITAFYEIEEFDRILSKLMKLGLRPTAAVYTTPENGGSVRELVLGPTKLSLYYAKLNRSSIVTEAEVGCE